MNGLRRLALALSLVSILPPSALAQSGPVKLDAPAPKAANLDFEAGEPGTVPPGWSATTASGGFPAEASAERPKGGKLCAVVRAAASPTGQFGILMQSVDAAAYRGHRVRLRGSLRASDARAMLWLRVDRSGKRMGFFDNMMNRAVTSPDWQTVETVADIDDDAESLNFGLLMIGTGSAWIDDVALDDLGKVTVAREPARALTGRGLANLEAFARLLGYVRFFHPSDEAAATDWETFAVEGVRRVEAATSPDDLARTLDAIFRPVAPTVRIAVTGAKLERPKELDPPTGDVSVTQWRHKGCGAGSQHSDLYASERVRGPFAAGKPPEGFHDPRAPFVAKLPGGVTAAIPIALFADDKGTLPHAAPHAAATTSLVSYSGADRATRLADVALAWNVFEHFYPYFDVEKVDWPAELERALTSAATDADAEAFTVTLRRMVAALHDGHGGVAGPAPSRAAALPVLWAWVENQLVVTVGGEGLAPGDVLEKIDGRLAVDALDDIERLTSSATPQWARFRALRELRSGPEGSTVTLDVRTVKGERKSVTLKRTTDAVALAEKRPEKVSELKPGVFYVNVDQISDADFTAALPKLEQAKGIVFDLRGYPNNLSPMPHTHLTATPLQSARWNIPVITDPDWTGTPGWDTSGRWELQPAAPRLAAKIAFVVDGRAISYAESWMGIVEAYKLAEIVGETTAGTNGDVNPFALPGGYTVYPTGMKVLKHDGSRHHGVGIAPTVPVSRTIKGVAEGRDEQLDRAVAVVGGNP
jgi:hypothetical protein